MHTVEVTDGPVAVDWDSAESLDLAVDELRDSGDSRASYADCPPEAGNAKAYSAWSKDYARWLRQNERITLYSHKRFRLTSALGETEGEFRARLQDAASEVRDLAIAKIRKRYSGKVTTLENRLMRAEQSIAVQKEQSTKKKLDTAVSFGTAILGAVLGRKRISSTSASKMGTAIKTASSARKEAADVERAKATADKVRADIAKLSNALEQEIAELDTAFDAQAETLDEIVIRARSTDIHVTITGLVWLPYVAGEKGRLQPAW